MQTLQTQETRQPQNTRAVPDGHDPRPWSATHAHTTRPASYRGGGPIESPNRAQSAQWTKVASPSSILTSLPAL